jgi:YVTN family beta-propeller protein
LVNKGMTNGTRVGIAVLDSGIEEVTRTNPQRNPDLPPTAGGKSFVSYTRSTNDDFGHGTEVAGIIAAGDNNFGVVGVAPEADLYSLKVTDSLGHFILKDLTSAVDWVLKNSSKIQVANISLGATLPTGYVVPPSNSDCTNGTNKNKTSDMLHMAICRAVKQNVTFVVAAGNDMVDASTVIPAAYGDPAVGGEVITVGALADIDGKPLGLGSVPATWASDCPTETNQVDDEVWWNDIAVPPAPRLGSNYGNSVTIFAPGVCILTTVPTWGANPPYRNFTGTSAAAPFVAGAAALYKQSHPLATPAQIKAGLLAIQEAGPFLIDPNLQRSGDPSGVPQGLLQLSKNIVYVSSSGLGTTLHILSVIEGNTETAVVLLPNNSFLEGVALAGNQVYISDDLNKQVYVVDAWNNTLKSTVPVFPQPNATDVNATADGSLVYVAGGSPVSVISTNTNTVTATQNLALPPSCVSIGSLNVAIDPSSAQAYFTGTANCQSGGITVGQPVLSVFSGSPFLLSAAPSVAAAVSTTGTIYVVGGDSVSVLPGGSVITVNGAVSLTGVVIAPDGSHVYATDYGSSNVNGSVSVIDALTNSVTATIALPGTHPRSLTITPDGRRLYVADFTGSIVYVIDTTSNLVVNTIAVGQGFASPYHITSGLLPLL